MLIKKYLCVIPALAFLLAACGKDVETYKVEDVGGVPRITFDGKPQRTRML